VIVVVVEPSLLTLVVSLLTVVEEELLELLAVLVLAVEDDVPEDVAPVDEVSVLDPLVKYVALDVKLPTEVMKNLPQEKRNPDPLRIKARKPRFPS
jgi:hypothetical protein